MNDDDILCTPPLNLSTPLIAGNTILIPTHAPVPPYWTVDPRRSYSSRCLVHLAKTVYPSHACIIVDLRFIRGNPNKLKGGAKAVVSPHRLNEIVDRISRHDGVAVVHCRHGINRTGMVCCAVLIKSTKITVDSAIVRFEAIRGPMRDNARRSLKAWYTTYITRDKSE